MPDFHHILFPVDFSERCRALRPFVKSIGERFGAKLTLMHVIQLPPASYGDLEGGFPIMIDVPAMLQDGQKQLDSFFESPAPSLSVQKVVEQGDPAACITSYAEQHGIDLILMPTHGYGKFRSLLLGSVTAKVLHDAKCAVWTTAHTENPKLASRPDFRSILCAVDLAPESAGLMRYAANLAQEFKAKLRLVHAVSITEARPEKYMDTEFNQALFEMDREEIAKLQRQAGTELELCLAAGSVSTVVRNAAVYNNADLVVIGRGKLKDAFGRLRTNAYAVIRDSPCPVLSV